MLENGSVTDEEERGKLDYLLKTKKWNPYCIRHSAITSDSDFLPEYALKDISYSYMTLPRTKGSRD
jgi:integrase/recombinase XerD